jgi:hypothetical protein
MKMIKGFIEIDFPITTLKSDLFSCTDGISVSFTNPNKRTN